MASPHRSHRRASLISDRLRGWFRRAAEKIAGTYYEGPDAPARIVSFVQLFAVLNPTATRSEWIAMAEDLAREAYTAGWQRGFEHAERDLSEPDPTPESIADVLDPSWRERAYDWTWAADLPVPGGLDLVPEDDVDDARLAASIEAAKEDAHRARSKVVFGSEER